MAAWGSPNEGHGRGLRRYGLIAEINVTPFVDVMLVLLVVFMVTAPLLQAGIAVDLPEADAPPLAQDNTPLTVTMDRAGRLYLGDADVALGSLRERLRAVGRARDPKRTVVYLRADKSLAYGDVVKVMAEIRGAGFLRIALVSENVPPRHGESARNRADGGDRGKGPAAGR
ncbi:MAG: biopolymer transporter ExbD [Alphaproteobacteria bacterium]|nr:MAG: biopolymer transporter ExbD [Alphaproteobacteria bacterium]